MKELSTMSSAIYDSAYTKRITVFTPTYNRAYILKKLYFSLQRQSFTDFEWLIVDDGSTDDTVSYVQTWTNAGNTFSIRYYKQKNGGKHRAINYGLQLAEGELFFVVDSDDYLTDDALMKIDVWFKEARDNSLIGAIAANKGISKYETPNEVSKKAFLDQSFLEMGTFRENGRLVLNGEKAIVFYTELHRKYPYPEFEGEKFLTEAVVYNRIANDGYITRFYNDIICIYQYQTDGLSANGMDIYLNNPHGYGLWIYESALFHNKSIVEKWKMYYSFYCDLRGMYPIKTIAESIGTSELMIHFCQAYYCLKHKCLGR